MKTPVIVLIIVLLLALALSIGINIGIILDRDPLQTSPTPSPTNGNTMPPTQSSPTPTKTINPTPIATPPPRKGTVPDHDITVNYSEASRRTIEDNMTEVIVSIHLQYGSGDSVTINYNKFILSIQAPRSEIIQQKVAEAYPLEAGSVTVSHGNGVADFQLTFRFATTYTTFTGLYHFTDYYLVVLI